MTGAAAAPLVPRGFILGVVTVLVGLVFLADSVGMLDAATGWAIWPIVVIVAGIAIRLQPGVASQVLGIFLIVGGVWVLFNEIGIWAYGFWRTWPLILILLGAWIRYRSWHFQHLADTGHVGTIVFLSHVTSATGRVVRSGELSVLVGDGEFDFGDAIPGAEPIIVNVLAIAGRLRVAVPSHWNVGTRVLAMPGRVSDARAGGAADGVDRPFDLIVQGTAMLGVVEIVTSTAAPLPARAMN